jgi:choline dehydrogenase
MQDESPEFDHVIVGAGSAGAVLAARLTEDPQTTVALLEAGEGNPNDFLIQMPLGMLRALLQPKYATLYFSEPEPHLNGRRIMLPRGRMLGGSSSINGMFYMRGHSHDYDRWAQMGCTGWSYADVLPYFRKMETSWRGANEYHGDSGPLHIVPNARDYLLHDQVMESAHACGYPATDDIHGEQEEGVTLGELTIDPKGRRASTYSAYLKPALDRPNLTVITGASANRILLEGRRAVGVSYRKDGAEKSVRAGKEVLVCGGTYQSPQLLMLSGIGPTAHLREQGVEVVHDLPGVGENLREHAHVPLLFRATTNKTFLSQLRIDRAVTSVLRWKLTGAGPFSRQVNSANFILRTDPRLAQPDVQLWSNPIAITAQLWGPFVRHKQQHTFSGDVILLHPNSRGWVRLKSADPAEAPAIQLNLFADAADFATARAGIRMSRRVYRCGPMAELAGEELLPGEGIDDDAALDEHIRANAAVNQHPIGTCAMGTGPMSVVGPDLRVHGIGGLRVIDASVMPDLPGGNTNAPTIMIAERAADLIKGQGTLPRAEIRRRENAA